MHRRVNVVKASSKLVSVVVSSSRGTHTIKCGTLGVLLSVLVINDSGRVLTMFMLSQVGAAVRAHSRQCQSTRGLPAVVGRSQTKGLDLGCTNLPQATIIDSFVLLFRCKNSCD